MLFNLACYFKSDGAAKAAAEASAFDDHLAQPFLRIPLAGRLRDADGRERGFMVVLEADSFEAARRFLESSPNYGAGLYERVEVLQLDLEVGRLS